jgi:hypothetical protein
MAALLNQIKMSRNSGPNAKPKVQEVLPFSNTPRSIPTNDLCQPTTEDVIRDIKDTRKTIDWNYVSSLQSKRDKVKAMVNAFKANLSWAMSGSKLSVANLNSKFKF